MAAKVSPENAKEERILFQRVMDMESAICDAENSISIMYRLLDDNFGKPHTSVTGDPNKWILTDHEVSDMFFVSNLLGKFIRQIKKDWNEALEAGR